MSETYSALDVLGAIRLAMAAGADAVSQATIIDEILARAPEPEPTATAPTRLFIDAVRAAGGRFHTDPQGGVVVR